MPTNRTRRTRKTRTTNISPAWRNFFETGANDNKTEEDADIFIVSGSDKEIVAAWEPYREALLVEWKKEGRKGLPWAEKVFIGWKRKGTEK